MATTRTRRLLSVPLAFLLALSVAPAALAAPPAAPEAEIYPPADNHADGSRRAATNQDLTVEGHVEPGATLEVYLEQRDANGELVPSEPGNANPFELDVEPDPSGDFSTVANPREFDSTETIHVRAVATNADGTSQSQPDQLSFVTVDRDDPRISAYAVTTTSTIRVTFSENVWHPNPNGDDPRDWTVTSDSGSQTPTRVEQPAGRNVRILHLAQALPPDAVPTVEYEPFDPDLLQNPAGVYEDEVQQELSSEGRQQQAADGVAPSAPSIDQIAGESTPARGNDSTPTIRVTGLSAGATAEVFRASNDASMGSATAGSEGTATITVQQPLGDGDPPETYSFYAIATDPNGNASDPGPQADYTLDTVAPTAQNAVVDPDETGDDTHIAVFFSEQISGTNAADQWSLSGCLTGCPSVIAVTGEDGSSQRRLETDGAVPEGATLSWDPPATGGYTDEAGNAMDAFDGLDVDTELPAFLQVLPAGTVSEGADVATFTVQLTEPESGIVVVSWSTRDGTANAGEDYESDSGLLTFLPGQTEQQAEVPLEDDSTDEPDETFSVEITQSSGAPVDEDQRSAPATITDDDPAPSVSLSGDAGVPEGDDEHELTLPVTLAAESGKEVTVSWTTSSGTATAGQDYESASGIITLSPGATSGSIPITILGDTVGEPDETVRLTLTGATNATIDRATTTLTIVNDDPTAFRARDASVAEPASGSVPVEVQITAVPPPTQTATVDWETVDGTATAGQDYEAASGTLTFEPGEASHTVSVQVHANGDGETAETFRVRLSNATGETTIADAEAVVTIGTSSAGAACPATQVPDAAFDDVTGIHADNVACASWYTIALGKGDIDGDGRPEYQPGGFVTRAQMASFIARLAIEAGVDLPSSPPNAFDDDDSSVHTTAIDQLAALDIVQGRADTGDADGDGNTSEVLYFPHERVTRAQMATFIARVHAEAAGQLAAGSNAFEDDDGSVHRENVDRIAAAGIVNGRRDTTDADGDGDRDEILYFPADPVTRGQMATFLMQDLGELVEDGAAHVGGAAIELTSTSVDPGDDLAGTVETNKDVRGLVADGCGLDDDPVTVASDRDFSVTIPADQPAGDCTLELTVRTRRDGASTDQAATHTETITVR